MKTDAYTKIVLTIIAICLIILAGKSSDSSLLVSTAQAQGRNIMDVNIVEVDGLGIRTGLGSLPVNIAQISGQDFGKPVNPYAVPNFGNTPPPPALPVKITEK